LTEATTKLILLVFVNWLNTMIGLLSANVNARKVIWLLQIIIGKRADLD